MAYRIKHNVLQNVNRAFIGGVYCCASFGLLSHINWGRSDQGKVTPLPGNFACFDIELGSNTPY